jgi:Zn finger protein HypA/HybF involved in hydrogenase expression
VPAGGPLRCPACGAPARLVSGDDILLERLDLEVPDV